MPEKEPVAASQFFFSVSSCGRPALHHRRSTGVACCAAVVVVARQPQFLFDPKASLLCAGRNKTRAAAKMAAEGNSRQFILDWENAISRDDLFRVQRILRSGRLDVNLQYNHRIYKWSALHHASCRGFLRIVRVLLEHGAEVNKQDERGRTALQRAIWNIRNLDVAQFLLEQGADPNIRNNSGQTALHIATHKATVDFMPVLLKYGADLEAKNNYGYTPLHCVCIYDFSVKSTVQFLLANGADMNSTSNYGNSVLWSACLGGKNAEIVRLLLQHGAAVHLNTRSKGSGRTILHEISLRSERYVKVMEVLLQYGAKPKITDSRGNLPLHVACQNGSLGAIYVLFQRMLGDGSISFRGTARNH